MPGAPAPGEPADFSGPATWTPAPPPPAAPSKSFSFGSIIGIVAVVAVIAGLWFGYQSLSSENVPASIQAYADGDTGQVYESLRGDYSVRLSGPPVEEAMSFPILGFTSWIEMAFHESPDVVTGVMFIDLPPGSGFAPEMILEGGALGLSTVGGADVVSQKDTTHQGYPAMDVKVDVPGATGWMRMIVVGDRAYVGIAAAPEGAGAAFDALTESFTLGV